MTKKKLCVCCGNIIPAKDVFEDLKEISASGKYDLVICRICAGYIEENAVDVNEMIGEH